VPTILRTVVLAGWWSVPLETSSEDLAMVRFRSLCLSVARVAAVSFALVTLAWFVVAAHRNANAPRATTPAPAEPAPALATSAPAEGGIDPLAPVAIDPVPAPAPKRVFFGSSKSAPVIETEVLDVFNFHQPEPHTKTRTAPTTTPVVGEVPVFLPSSKIGQLSVPLPPLVPGDARLKCAPVTPKP
jgi:hypothetical protein